MRITRIDFEGAINTNFAIATCKRGSEFIDVEIFKPDNHHTHHVNISCDDDIRSMAKCLQFELDGHQGTGTEANRYYREFKNMTY